jgi:hypothetical protein
MSGIKRYTNYDLQSARGLFRIDDNEQRFRLAQRGFGDAFLAPVYHFGQETLYKAGALFNPQDKQLSKEELNAKYGTEGLQFEEGTYESLARLRRERHDRKLEMDYLLDKSSQNDQWYDHIGHAAFMFAGAALGDTPLAFAGVFGLAGKGMNYLARTKQLKKFNAFQKMASKMDTIAFGEKWGKLGERSTRIFRNGADNMVSALATEMMLQVDADNIGIDRTLAETVFTIGFAGLFGGLFGAIGAEAPIVDNVIKGRKMGRDFVSFFDDIGKSLQETENWLAYNARVYSDIFETRRISLQGEMNLIMKSMEDFNQMRVADLSGMNAMLYADNLITLHKPFMKAVDGGAYDGVIPSRDYVRGLSEKELTKAIPKYNFAKMVEDAIPEGLNPTEAFQLENIFDRGVKDFNIGDFDFRAFREEVLRIQKSLKGKRIVQDPIVNEDTPIKNFFNLKSKTKEDIAKLYYMLNPDTEKMFSYDELINLHKLFDDDDILTAFHRHKYTQEVESLFDSSKEALDVMKKGIYNPDEKIKIAQEEAVANIEQRLQEPTKTAEELNVDIEGSQKRLLDELGLEEKKLSPEEAEVRSFEEQYGEELRQYFPEESLEDVRIADQALKEQDFRVKIAECLLNG